MSESSSGGNRAAADPTGSQNRRWGLILGSLLGLVLGIGIGLLAYQVHLQRTAVNAFRGAGGMVYYSGECDSRGFDVAGRLPHGPAWLRKWGGHNLFDHPVAVRLYYQGTPRSGRELIEQLGRLRHLKLIVIDGIELHPQDLAPLAKLSELTSLSLESTVLADTDLDVLSGLPLTWLGLQRTRISDRGVRSLREMQTLKHLDLTRTRVTDKGIRALEGLTGLESLVVARCKVTSAGAERFRQKVPGCRVTWELLLVK